MADQEIRLRVTKQGDGAGQVAADLKNVQAAAKATEAATYDLAESLATVQVATTQVSAGTYELSDNYKRLSADLTESNKGLDRKTAAAVEATRAQKLMTSALNDTGVSAVKLGEKVETLAEKKRRLEKAQYAVNSRVLEFGRAFQDISQGGIAGGINNIERLVGGAGAWAGILTIAGTAVYLFKDQIVEFVDSLKLFNDKVGTEGMLGALEKVESRLKSTTKELDALKAQQSLTSDEVVRYNTLSARQVELEKEKSEEMEKQRRIAALQNLKDPAEEKAAKVRAEAIQAGLGGTEGEVVAGVEASAPRGRLDALLNEQSELMRRVKEYDFRNRGVGNPDSLEITQARARIRGLAGEIQKEQENRRTAAQDLVARAVVGGDRDAIEEVSQVTYANPANFTDQARQAFDAGRDAVNAAAREKAAKEKRKRDEEDEQAAKDILDAGVRGDREQAEKAAKEQEDAAKKLAARRQARGRDLAGSIGDSTGVDERAGALAAGMRGEGRSEEEIIARLTPQIAARLKRDMGNAISRDDAQLAGRAMAEDAAGAGTEMLLRAGQMGLGNQARTNAVLQSMIAGQMQQARDLDALAQQVGGPGVKPGRAAPGHGRRW